MSHAIETAQIDDLTVNVYIDDDFQPFEDTAGDEPVALVYWDRYRHIHVIHDATTDTALEIDVIRAIENNNFDYLADFYNYAWHVTQSGKIAVDYGQALPRLFKNKQNAFKAILINERIENMRVEQLSSQNGYYYLVWNQNELDKYAGIKNATPPTETAQAWIDDDIYQFVVTDSDENVIEASCGYVGDAAYALSNGMEAAANFIAMRAKSRLAKLKTCIRNHVPLGARAEILASR